MTKTPLFAKVGPELTIKTAMFRPISSLVAIAAIGAMLVPSAVFAHPATSGNVISWSSWSTEGNASVDKTDHVITLSEKEGEKEYAYQDVSASKHVNEYVTFASYTYAEDVRSGGDITGLPYLYAYALDKNGKVLSYLQGQQMLHDEDTDDGEWAVSYGTFRVPAKATKVRFFVKQASESGETKSGDDAIFFEPGVYYTSSSSLASAIVTRYKNNLSDVADETDIGDDNGTDNTGSTSGCTDSRSKQTITVKANSTVYADDADSDSYSETWTLWAANKTAWNWNKWGDEHPLSTSNDSSASGSVCLKTGDVILLNGSYMDGSQYLAYKNSSKNGADYISSITIAGKSYTIFSDWHDVDSGDRACTFVKNSSNGYDLSCTVK